MRPTAWANAACACYHRRLRTTRTPGSHRHRAAPGIRRHTLTTRNARSRALGPTSLRRYQRLDLLCLCLRLRLRRLRGRVRHPDRLRLESRRPHGALHRDRSRRISPSIPPGTCANRNTSSHARRNTHGHTSRHAPGAPPLARNTRTHGASANTGPNIGPNASARPRASTLAHNLAHALPTPRTLAAALAHAKAPANPLPRHRRATGHPRRKRRLSRPRLPSSPTPLAALRATDRRRATLGHIAHRHIGASHQAPVASTDITPPTSAHRPRKIRGRKATTQPARASCTGTDTGASSNTGATAYAQATRIRTASPTTLSLPLGAAGMRRPRSPRVATGAIGQRTRGRRRVATPHSVGLLADDCGVVSCRSGTQWRIGRCVRETKRRWLRRSLRQSSRQVNCL